tara:strand:- start:1297 stop:1821 length:525 start_codon:yes stop_codon:yes gene_type:complete
MEILIPAWLDGTLQPVEKLQTHLCGLRHKAVSVFVMRGEETLLQRRALEKYHTPGLWANACCTHPEWGEAGLDCAIRRLDEELGILGQAPVYRDTVEYSADVGGGMVEHEVVEIFLVQASDITVIANPGEVMDHRWVCLQNLASEIAEKPQDFTPWLKIYLGQHATKIFGDHTG